MVCTLNVFNFDFLILFIEIRMCTTLGCKDKEIRKSEFKGTDVEISSDPPFQEERSWFTTVPFNALSD